MLPVYVWVAGSQKHKAGGRMLRPGRTLLTKSGRLGGREGPPSCESDFFVMRCSLSTICLTMENQLGRNVAKKYAPMAHWRIKN